MTGSSPDAKAGPMAALTPGSTGANLANLVGEAAILATRTRGRFGVPVVAVGRDGHPSTESQTGQSKPQVRDAAPQPLDDP